MESKSESKITKSKPTSLSTVNIRVKRETKKRLLAELARVNKKSHGKNVKLDAMINKWISRTTPQDILEWQEESLTHFDRFDMDYKEYVKAHGHISKDEYLGITRSSSKYLDKSNTNHVNETLQK